MFLYDEVSKGNDGGKEWVLTDHWHKVVDAFDSRRIGEEVHDEVS